jgi:hypothetical protein
MNTRQTTLIVTLLALADDTPSFTRVPERLVGLRACGSYHALRARCSNSVDRVQLHRRLVDGCSLARAQRSCPRRSPCSPEVCSASLTVTLLAYALALLALLVLVQNALQWSQRRLDDLRYGFPKTTSLDAFVGHGEAQGLSTHLRAVNLHGQIVVVEFPGMVCSAIGRHKTRTRKEAVWHSSASRKRAVSCRHFYEHDPPHSPRSHH